MNQELNKRRTDVPKVFIPTLPTRYDAATRARVPALDINPALRYGELVTMIDEGEELDELVGLSYAIAPGDYILAIGDIAALIIVTANVCHRLGSAQLLRWDRKKQDYYVTEVVL